MIRVVNRSSYTGVACYVGRPGPLANPYTHVPSKHAQWKVENRDEAVDRYQEWLTEKLKTDNETSQAFKELVDVYRDFGGLVLSCWCAPKRCHAEVIAEMIKNELGENSEHAD